jgi:hypothetical protein
MGTKKAAAAETKRTRQATTLIGNGYGNSMTIIAGVLKSGKFRTQVIHRVGTKTERGMITLHDTFEAATKAANELATRALANGWKEREKKAAKVTFTELPKPAPTPVAKPPKKERKPKAAIKAAVKPITPIRKSA